MYEDDPQDTVFDVLGEAVFGGHPLGRPIIGRAPVIRDTPVDAIAAFHASRYVPGLGRHRRRRLGRSRRGRRARRAHARRRPGASDVPRRRARARRAGADRPLPAQGHRAVPRLPRRPRAAARRRPPLRRARARRDLRRPVLVAAVPGRARASAASPTRVYSFAGQYADTGQIGLYVGTRPDKVGEAMQVVGEELDAPARAARQRGGARPRAGERQGAHRARAGVDRRADEPARRFDAVRAAAARDRRGDGAHRRGHARRPARAGRRAVGARAACPRPASAPTRTRSARPSRASARAEATRHDPRGRRRRRGAHGTDGLRRRRRPPTT